MVCAAITPYSAGMNVKVQAGAVRVKRVRKAKAEEPVVREPVRKKRALAVGALVGKLVEPALARHGAALALVLPHWGAICPMFARYSVPESVKNGVLTVAVATDAVKQELLYMSPQLVEGVNMLLGYEVVRKVRAVTRSDVGKKAGLPKVTASLPARAGEDDRAQGLCKNVRDEGLRAALARLGSQLLNTKKGR